MPSGGIFSSDATCTSTFGEGVHRLAALGQLGRGGDDHLQAPPVLDDGAQLLVESAAPP